MTTELIQQQRQAIAAEAQSWIGTPFRDHACIKGAGVDCATLLAAVLGKELGEFQVPRYPQQWFLHANDDRAMPEGIEFKSEEWYIEYLLGHGFIEIPESAAGPGDIVLSKLGEKVFCHAGIIVDWPSRVIHATSRAGSKGAVREVRARACWHFSTFELKWFSFAGWHGQRS